MKNLLILVFGLLSVSLAAQEVKEIPIEVTLGIDKIIKLNFSPDPRIQVGNEAFLTFTLIPSKREVVLKGVKPGKSSLVLRNSVGDIKAKYLVTVVSNEGSALVKELKDFLGDVEGLEIGYKSGTVYIDGKIVVPTDIGRVITVIKQEKFADVLFLVELSPQTQRVIARKMQEEIQKNQLRSVTVRVVNGLYWLEGVVESNGQKDLAEQIAKAFFPPQLPNLAKRTDSVEQPDKSPIQNFISVNEKKKQEPPPKLIKITTQFVELSKDYKRVFGFKWQPLLSDGQGSIRFGKTNSGDVTTSSTNSLSGTISNLFPKLASAKEAGYARVIQSGVLVVKDKTKGEIRKQEEIPFALGTGEFTKPEKANAGFSLSVKPTILAQEKVDLDIGVNVKAAIGDPPKTLNNEVKTAIVVKSKESAVVGGIVVNKTSTDYDKTPPGGVDEAQAGSSPLFSFIRSKSAAISKSQFVVFITPEIVDSAANNVDEIKRKFRRRGR